MDLLKPYQERVFAEKAELDEKLTKLVAFFETRSFSILDEAERSRLRCQALFMHGYSSVLGERIAAFS